MPGKKCKDGPTNALAASVAGTQLIGKALQLHHTWWTAQHVSVLSRMHTCAPSLIPVRYAVLRNRISLWTLTPLFITPCLPNSPPPLIFWHLYSLSPTCAYVTCIRISPNYPFKVSHNSALERAELEMWK